MLRRAAALLLGAFLVVGWAAPKAIADDQVCHTVTTCDASGKCTSHVVCTGEDPGDPPAPGGPGGDNPGSKVCVFKGKQVACGKNGWWYSSGSGCYYKAEPGQDPKRFNYLPNWAPGGAVYAYYCLPSGPASFEETWLPNPPPGYGGPGVNPRDLAVQAIKQMQLSPLGIGIVPKPGKQYMGLVGMPTWMWAANPAANVTGPDSITLSAGGVTVVTTATLGKVVWDMGDGDQVTCEGEDAKGTPYDGSYGRQDSPTCGYRYATTSGGQPGEEYTVTATSYWSVAWTGAGQSGTITVAPLTSTTHIRVGEVQVLEQTGSGNS